MESKVGGLLKEELLIGGLYGFIFSVYWISVWAVVVSILCAYLWALSGSEFKYNSKLFRRFGCPLLVCGSVAIAKMSWIPLISIVPALAVLSIGYGIPSVNDEGSTLGKFWYKISQKHANLLTRSTIYTLLTVSHICLVF